MAAYRNPPVLYIVPGTWSLVMYLMQAILLAIIVACVRQTGPAEFLGLPQPDTADVHTPQLVTNGWYGIVRHPLYLFSMLFLAFNPVVTSRWLILSLFSFAYFIIGALIEEQRLLHEFGNDYRLYRQRVPFLIPAFSKSRKATPRGTNIG
jgi:protein-S-isoprenylcysteine O-methyltransferase Ste14